VLVENIQKKLTQQSSRSGRISSVHVSPTRELMLSRRLLGQLRAHALKLGLWRIEDNLWLEKPTQY